MGVSDFWRAVHLHVCKCICATVLIFATSNTIFWGHFFISSYKSPLLSDSFLGQILDRVHLPSLFLKKKIAMKFYLKQRCVTRKCDIQVNSLIVVVGWGGVSEFYSRMLTPSAAVVHKVKIHFFSIFFRASIVRSAVRHQGGRLLRQLCCWVGVSAQRTHHAKTMSLWRYHHVVCPLGWLVRPAGLPGVGSLWASLRPRCEVDVDDPLVEGTAGGGAGRQGSPGLPVEWQVKFTDCGQVTPPHLAK